jgi:hypothetical protein
MIAQPRLCGIQAGSRVQSLLGHCIVTSPLDGLHRIVSLSRHMLHSASLRFPEVAFHAIVLSEQHVAQL